MFGTIDYIHMAAQGRPVVAPAKITRFLSAVVNAACAHYIQTAVAVSGLLSALYKSMTTAVYMLPLI